MKKSKLALGILAVLGAVWVGGAWFTGSTLEKEYQGYVTKLNDKMAKDFDLTGIMGKIDNVQLNRGVFSSDYRYDLTFIFPDYKWIIPMEGKLYHGPLPLNRLIKFNLLPVMFSDVHHLAKTENTKAVFESSNGKSPVSGEYAISYSQQIKGYMDIVSGQFKSDGLEMAWGNGKASYNTDLNGVGKVDFDVDKLNTRMKPELFGMQKNGATTVQYLAIEYRDLKVNTDIKSTEWKNLYSGSIKIDADSIKYALVSDNPKPFEIKDFKLDYNAENEKDLFNYQVNVSGEARLNEISLGKLNLDFKLNHLLAKPLERLIVTDLNNQAEIQALGVELLQNQPYFIVSPLKLTNASGKIESNLNLEFDKIDYAQLAQGKYLSVLKQLSFNFYADKTAIKEILSDLGQVKGMTKTDAEDDAKAEMELAIPNLVEDGMILDKGNFVTTTLDLNKTQNGVNFNDNFIPENALGMLLLGFMMHFAK